MTRAGLAEIDPFLEPQVAHAPTILLDPAKMGVDTASSATRLGSGSMLLNRFKLLEMIGEGGMSRVYKAVDLRKVEAGAADPHIAIKVLTVPFASPSDAMAVLSREAHSLQSLTHPNIVRVFDCDRDNDIVFMTMELLCGQSLFDKMRAAKGEGGLSRDTARRLIKSIADALEFAHCKNILHGDLKPGNVFITDTGEIKVIDFGLARLMVQPGEVQPKSVANAADRMRALTPAYASPEMLENEEPDPRDDVYALACVAWKLLTGKLPFKAKDPSAARNVAQLACPRELSRREFRALCHALQFEREKRTPSARQFLLEFSGAGSKISWPVAAGIAVSMTALIAAAAFFAPHPAAQKTRTPPVAPAVATAPPAPAPGQVFRDCPTCPLMKVLAPGDFQQGTPAGADALAFEMPQHKVTIAHPFAVGVYDVTVGEYSEFVAATGAGANGCATYDGAWRVKPSVTWRNAIDSQTPSHPVSCVSWQEPRTMLRGCLTPRTRRIDCRVPRSGNMPPAPDLPRKFPGPRRPRPAPTRMSPTRPPRGITKVGRHCPVQTNTCNRRRWVRLKQTHSACTTCSATFSSGPRIAGPMTTRAHRLTDRRDPRETAPGTNCAADPGSRNPTSSGLLIGIASTSTTAAPASVSD